jgi:hypothetical protein
LVLSGIKTCRLQPVAGLTRIREWSEVFYDPNIAQTHHMEFILRCADIDEIKGIIAQLFNA